MATARLDYPTAAAPTASLTFPRGSRMQDDTPRISFVQEVKRSLGGAPDVKSYGTARQVIPVTFVFARSSEVETDLADVMSFLITTLKGAVNACQWTDEDGTVRTVRNMSGDVDFPVFGYDGQRCVLNLEIEN
jgi:hypothetical protein